MAPRTIKIDEIEYVRSDIAREIAVNTDGLEYCIVRTYSAGVFAGFVEKRDKREVTLREARRLWMWKGAASLSQLATSGTSKPKDCKFPESVEKILLLEAVEIITCTKEAEKIINEVPIWKE